MGTYINYSTKSPQQFECDQTDRTQNAQQAEGLDVSKNDESTVNPGIYHFPLVPVIYGHS